MTFSVESYGEVNEYIRFPMNWELWYNNFTRILFDTPVRATLNMTVGALNYPLHNKYLISLLIYIRLKSEQYKFPESHCTHPTPIIS